MSDQRARQLVEQIATEKHSYGAALDRSAAFRELSALDPAGRRAGLRAMLAWLNAHTGPDPDGHVWQVRACLLAVLAQPLPLTAADLYDLLAWSARQEFFGQRGAPEIIQALEHYSREQAWIPELHSGARRLIAVLQTDVNRPGVSDWISALRRLAGITTPGLPLVSGEAWADTATAEIEALGARTGAAWDVLLRHCQTSAGSEPSKKWLAGAQLSLAQIGGAHFKSTVIRWVDLVDKPRTEPLDTGAPRTRDPNQAWQYSNADIVKGLVWLSAGRADHELARALCRLAQSAFRKLPGSGPQCARVGNACLWALGQMPSLDGLDQLVILKARLKLPSAQKAIAKALATAAQRLRLEADELEELAVPSYDLTTVGRRRVPLGEFTAELRVTGVSSVALDWRGPDGKARAAAPAAVKREHADELKALNQSIKDIRSMLPAQRDRLDRLYLEPRQWRLRSWRERYLGHPLLGVLARRLIWKFTRGDQAASGIWWEGELVGRDGAPLAWLDEQTQVELWHPIQAHTQVVLDWRQWLNAHEVAQPFKQAHREIYVLTDAEQQTRVYSNRFAAHILRQHQFNALCAARGWRNQLRLMVDDTYPPATRPLPAWSLRAEYWVEGVGDRYGRDTNPTGTYLFVSTDQVRFYRQDAPENSAHAGGGGYHTGLRGDQERVSPLAVADVPPLVFSEVMRDVDLFAGVASVGNDPAWGDRGPDTPHMNYWSAYSFGALSETAQTRHALLAGLLPKLKIADRCQLTERFLVVRGELRTYKIHLGSGNILMEPNDQYLCIVPAQGQAGQGAASHVFLPFEGDQTLAIILSKAFLLAADKAIKDLSIVRQIAR